MEENDRDSVGYKTGQAFVVLIFVILGAILVALGINIIRKILGI